LKRGGVVRLGLTKLISVFLENSENLLKFIIVSQITHSYGILRVSWIATTSFQEKSYQKLKKLMSVGHEKNYEKKVNFTRNSKFELSLATFSFQNLKMKRNEK
jgi:hypothetical protein